MAKSAEIQAKAQGRHFMNVTVLVDVAKLDAFLHTIIADILCDPQLPIQAC